MRQRERRAVRKRIAKWDTRHHRGRLCPTSSSCCQARIPGRSLPAVGERATLIRINDESVPPAIFIPKEVVSHAV